MADLEKFRKETRAWLEQNCPSEMRKPMTAEGDTFWGGRNAKFSSEAQRVWFERMRDKGWTVPHWPKEYGGGGLDGEEAKIVRQEMAAIGARQPLTSFGISMLGPALLKYGTEAQKKEHLPKITAGLIRWCQGYSEPNAGSDLASLQTRAVERRRRLRHQRPEDLDVLRQLRRLDFLPGAHRSAPRRSMTASASSCSTWPRRACRPSRSC